MNQALPSVAQNHLRKAGGQNRGKRLFVAGVMTPLLLYMLFWTLFPMLWAVTLAFFDYSATRNGGSFLGLGGDNPFIGLDHFRNMFSDSLEARQFRTSFKNTLLFAFIYLPLNLAVTIPLALIIEAVHQHFKTMFRFIYFLPTVTASVAVALIWGYLYHPQQGLINLMIKTFGGTPQIWLGDPRQSFLGVSLSLLSVIITYLWADMGYNLIIFIAALQGIPREFSEAARVDGANRWQLFWRITLPLLRPTLLFVCVLTMISSFQVFDIIQIMTQGNPQDQTRVMVLDIYQNAFRFQRMGWAGASSLVLFALILTVTVIQRRLLRTQWEY
jgi:multiple sugar transport system permease protein